MKHVFYNQALNTWLNYGCRANRTFVDNMVFSIPQQRCSAGATIQVSPVGDICRAADLWITDPPYADAIAYHEITEYFLAWLRKNPPRPDYVWDSRRALAIKGERQEFRRAMVPAFAAMARNMPDAGL